MTAEAFARLVRGARRSSAGYVGRCPAHEDEHESLTFADGKRGLVLTCHAGCDRAAIVTTLGLRLAALFSNTAARVTRYEVRDSAGQLVAVHVREDRDDGKRLWWERPDGRKGLGGLKVAAVPLYGIHALNGGAGIVLVVEGEKAAHALTERGFAAVATVTGAAVTPSDESLRPLLGRDIVLWPDHDAPGREHMRRIAKTLVRLGHRDVRELCWPDARNKDDAADFFARGGTVEACSALIKAAAPIGSDGDGAVPFGADENRGAAFNPTDAGNAKRLARDHGRDVRYCYAWACWLIWDGRRWARDPGDGLMTKAKQRARAIYAEAAAETDPDRRRAIAAWAKKSESRERLHAMLSLAQSEPGIPVTPDELDREGFVLNVQNGTLDLRTGALRPHQREDLCTKLAPITFDGAATCPRFIRFLDRIMDGDGERIAFLQRALGYSLTGDTRDQCFFVAWGAGANGKTTLLRTVFRLLGDYAAGTRAETFMVKHNDTIPNDVARLKGARFVLASEAEESQRFAESLVKGVTGGDVLTARFMRAEFFDFVPVLKLWLATNHRPVIRGTDHAMWRRVRLIPFDVTIAEHEKDPALIEKLAAEAPGILTWLVAGCRAWLAGGLGVPESVRVATGEYRAAMDTLGAFIAERCAVDADTETAARELYEEYQRWCAAGNEKPITKKAFGLRLTERGFVAIRTERERGWRGLRLRTLLDHDPDPDPETVEGSP